MPLLFKVYVIKAVCDVQRFVGLVNYYRDIWQKRTHTLSTLTKLCYTKVKFEWTEVEQKYFMDLKNIWTGHVAFIPYF